MLQLRKAGPADMEWINARYQEVDFVPSDLNREIVVVAEWNGVHAGLGRLVQLDEFNQELGGIVVFPEFRKHGIAKKIVEYLVQQVEPGQRVFCIPFCHLTSLYEQFGFTQRVHMDTVPPQLIKKYEWCKQNYGQPTILLVLPPHKAGKS